MPTENNPGYAKRVALASGTIANGATYQSETFALGSYGRVVGCLQCDKALTVKLYQGPTESAPGRASDSLTSSGNADFGAGDFFSQLIRVPEGYGQIRLTNSSGAPATFELVIGLTRAS